MKGEKNPVATTKRKVQYGEREGKQRMAEKGGDWRR